MGFGNGALLGWCRDRGINIIGTEIQDELVERANSMGFFAAKDFSAIRPESFDMVVALDVFEHIIYEDLVAVCMKLHDLLRPGAILIARFPNGDSPFSMPHKQGDPTHVNVIGSGFARKLMAESGFDVVELREPAEIPLTLSSRLKAPIKRGLRSIFWLVSKYTFMGNTVPSTFCMNYMMIARKTAK